MKKFEDLKIGDKLYYISKGSLSINEVEITGIARSKGRVLVFINGDDKASLKEFPNQINCVYNDAMYFASYEGACGRRDQVKYRFVEEQFRIAMSAFRNIKKIAPSDNSLRDRVLNFFQLSNFKPKES